jgi:hypothetical protein
MNMKTVGGNPFRIARPSRAQRFWLRDWLPGACAILGAAIFAMGFSSSAWAKPSGPLATTVWVANGGAFNAGSLETFAGGTKKNTKPLYRNIGPETLLQSFPGSPFFGTAPTGVAITFDSPHHVSVVGELVNAVLTFTDTANGDTPPETVLFGPDTGLGLPAGDTYGFSPLVRDTQQGLIFPFSELYVTNIASGFDGNGAVTEYPEGANGDRTPDEAIGGDAAVTFMAEPVGVYVDFTTFDACFGLEPTATDLCNNESGQDEIVSIPTRRIWVVQRFLGLVTLYVPEVACFLSPYNPGASPPVPGFCPGQSLNVALPSYVAQQPPLGGVFPTTVDGEFPPVVGGSSTDPTEPNFLAVQQYAQFPEVYITDLLGGFHNHGRIKFFYTIPIDQCLATTETTAGTMCTVAIRGGLYGLPDGTIEGKKANLKKPMGIAAQPLAVPVAAGQSSEYIDNLFVTNVDRNSIVQFSSTERGNVRPDAFIQGRRTKMNQPTGIAVPPELLISTTQQKP